MKKIIRGKKYDTDTAKKVADITNGYPVNDFHYFSEELYLKKSGEFFLHGEGGALSKYSGRDGDMMCYGEKIVPLSLEEAAAWCEKHTDVEVYEGLFGEIAEDDSRTTLTISLSVSDLEIMRRRAREAGVRIGEYIVAKCTE